MRARRAISLQPRDRTGVQMVMQDVSWPVLHAQPSLWGPPRRAQANSADIDDAYGKCHLYRGLVPYIEGSRANERARSAWQAAPMTAAFLTAYGSGTDHRTRK